MSFSKFDPQIKAECLARFQRCKQQLDSRNREGVRRWLDCLPSDERERCRDVLNSLVISRRNKKV